MIKVTIKHDGLTYNSVMTTEELERLESVGNMRFIRELLWAALRWRVWEGGKRVLSFDDLAALRWEQIQQFEIPDPARFGRAPDDETRVFAIQFLDREPVIVTPLRRRGDELDRLIENACPVRLTLKWMEITGTLTGLVFREVDKEGRLTETPRGRAPQKFSR
jgi:hypothetical protein